MRLSIAWLLSLVTVLCLSPPADAFSLAKPEQTGIGVLFGSSYNPEPTFGFTQLSFMALYDYEQIMPHRAPEALRFKLEGNLGLADDSRPRLLASANFFALYYLRRLETQSFRPYVEAGVGLAYGDFQVEGQGLRFNFNPQAGIGGEWQSAAGTRWYSAVRTYHLSNSNFHRDNRGINAVTMQLGLYF